MDELRDYQQGLLDKAESALQSPKARVMLQLPTGGGKTHIAGALLSRLLRDGRKAVWLTHGMELAEQTRRMLADAGVSAMNELAWKVGDRAPQISNGVVILMAQTVGRCTRKRPVWGNYGLDDHRRGASCHRRWLGAGDRPMAGESSRFDCHSVAAIEG